MMKTGRIGIFGGTFDPPHVGHLIVAEHVCDELGLDKLIFVPSYISPHKRGGKASLAADRMHMVRLATHGEKRFEVSDFEVRKKGTSYTYVTVAAFRRKYPGSEVFLLIGADNFMDFDTWKYPDRIVGTSTLVVMTRPSFDLKKSKPEFRKSAKFLPVPDIAISSTEIRRRIREGKSVNFLVPNRVQAYIIERKLYL